MWIGLIARFQFLTYNKSNFKVGSNFEQCSEAHRRQARAGELNPSRGEIPLQVCFAKHSLFKLNFLF
jgi:hypothetical protein